VEPHAERALVAALKRGDPAAFDRVYAAYRARVFGFLARMSGSRTLAEDLLQETWLRLARRARELADDTRLGPWLFTVARNLVVSHYRMTLLDAQRIDQLGLAGAGDAEEITPFEELAGSEARRRIERALALLPPAYREVVLLVAVERMAPSEAAEVLGLRGDAVRQRLARARGLLAEALEERPAARGAARSMR
jgi:RNA polymerase sigma-70 factor (ECF subfamily)